MLNQTATIFPGSHLRMRFAVRPPPRISLAFPGSPAQRNPAAVPAPAHDQRPNRTVLRYPMSGGLKLRCYLWKQWGPSGYRQLRKRGVSVREAWNTSKSAHGPWRLSKTPALALALPLRFFTNMGLPSLAAR